MSPSYTIEHDLAQHPEAVRSARPRPRISPAPGALAPRWLTELGRVLRFGRRASAVPERPAVSAAPSGPTERADAIEPPDSAFERLHTLAPRLRRAWSAETSVTPQLWSKRDPAAGQSPATACAVQDILGGEIVLSRVATADGRVFCHYANLVDGLVIDLAQTEIAHATPVAPAPDPAERCVASRAEVLAQPGAELGYAALTSRLAQIAADVR